jgi:hypothetical protein
MKDADPQQRNEILSFMTNIFVNAREGTCGFHVVHMGWKKNVPSCHNHLSLSKKKNWSSIVCQIQKWMYSWMNPGYVKDKDESAISKFLREKFISSKPVLDTANGDIYMIARIIKFLRYHVYTWETLYLHYLRKDVWHLDTSHSSAHEGTNHGLKSHSAGVKGTMDMDTSAKTLNLQTKMRAADIEEIIYHKANRTHKTWSHLPTSEYTVTTAEGYLRGIMLRCHRDYAKLVSKDGTRPMFHISFTGNGSDDVLSDDVRKITTNDQHAAKDYVESESDTDKEFSPIPVFSRMRHVTNHVLLMQPL